MTRSVAAPGSARLFLALWPAPGESAQLLRYLQQWAWPTGSSPVKHDRLHLTLHFIGPVDRHRVAEVSAGLLVPMAPFDLYLTRAEMWPRGLAVLGTTELPEELLRLHARLAGALQSLDLPVEARRFRPHVTLARRAAGAAPPLDTPQLCWQVTSYVLVESLPGPGGGYQVRRHYG